MTKLPVEFYQHHDVIELSKLLLGKHLFTKFNEQVTAGMIVETEAYRAPEDKASHAFGLKRTKRNQVMYLSGGHAYIYLCYGMYTLFNVITNTEGIPHGVLIRAIQPTIGLEIMQKRRNKIKIDRSLTGGPGALTQALGINVKDSGILLTGSKIWIEDRNTNVKEEDIIASPRVGIDYAEEYIHMPWRFRIKNSPWTSPAK